MARRPGSLLEMDSRSAERELSRGPVVIVPIGALEAHGPHLPLGSDQIQAEATAFALADRIGGLVVPALPYGVCAGARRFPGTVSLSMSTLSGLVRELLEELVRMGAVRLLVLSGHAAARHMAALREAADSVQRAHPNVTLAVLSDYDFVYELRGKDSPPTDGHGGLLESSRVLALAPDTVGPERPHVEDRRPPFRSGDPTADEWPESVVGDTRPANAELGARVQAHVLSRLQETVTALFPRA